MGEGFISNETMKTPPGWSGSLQLIFVFTEMSLNLSTMNIRTSQFLDKEINAVGRKLSNHSTSKVTYYGTLS